MKEADLKRRIRQKAAKKTETPEYGGPHATSEKQRLFLECNEFEALYGGAAGGGKTEALLKAAVQYVHVPGYAALLLRRTYPDLMLPDAILDRAKQWWIQQGVDWNDKDKRFTFPSGATVSFGYCDTENDKYRYAGAAFQFLAFDELTQWPDRWYSFLLSRVRKPEGMDVPLRVRCTANPGGIGHEWVKKRFVDPATRTAPFFPARLDDNPGLDKVSYRKSLSHVDPVTRKQLEEGIWIRDGGGLVYGHFDEARNVINEAPKDLKYKMLGLDFGIEDENAVAIVGWNDHDPTLYVLECYRRKAHIRELSDEVAKLEQKHRFEKIVGDEGGLGKGFADDMRRYHAVPVVPAEKAGKHGYISLLNAKLADGQIKVVRHLCRDLIHEWLTLPWNEKRTKECDGFDNHAADALLYVWRATTSFAETAAPKPMTWADYRQSQVDDHWARIDDKINNPDPDGWQFS